LTDREFCALLAMKKLNGLVCARCLFVLPWHFLFEAYFQMQQTRGRFT